MKDAFISTILVAVIAVVAAPAVWGNAGGDNPRADAYVAEGDQYLKAESPAKAAEAYTKALRLQPSNTEAQHGLGASSFELRQWKRGIPAMKSYVASVAPSPTVLAMLGEAYLATKQFREALASFQRALSLDEDDRDILEGLYVGSGTAYRELKQFDKAVSQLEEALKIDPEDSEANYQEGFTYLQMDRCEDALPPMERAVGVHPKAPAVQLVLGEINLCLGRSDEARRAYDVLKAIDPSSARSLYKDIEQEQTARSNRPSRPVAEAPVDEQPGPVDVIRPIRPIQFASGTTKMLEGGQRSLGDVVAFMVQHSEVTKVLIAAHTNSKTSDAASLELSKRRAIAVKTQLVEMGLDGERLVGMAFGRRKPIADNATAAGRAANDRVEFQFAEVNGRPSAVATDGILVP